MKDILIEKDKNEIIEIKPQWKKKLINKRGASKWPKKLYHPEYLQTK